MIRFYLKDKTEREEKLYTIDWKPHLSPGDSIQGATPTIDVIEGSVVVANEANNNAQGLTSFEVTGGVKGEGCVVVIGIDTTEGEKHDAECHFGVR